MGCSALKLPKGVVYYGGVHTLIAEEHERIAADLEAFAESVTAP